MNPKKQDVTNKETVEIGLASKKVDMQVKPKREPEKPKKAGGPCQMQIMGCQLKKPSLNKDIQKEVQRIEINMP